MNPIQKCQCSVFAKLRCGILPLHVETGWYSNTALENRLCEFCEKNIIEDEKHFMCSCSFYNDLRNSLYLKINYTQPEFQSMSFKYKFVYIIQNKQHQVAKFFHQAFSKRWQKSYNSIFRKYCIFLWFCLALDEKSDKSALCGLEVYIIFVLHHVYTYIYFLSL